jgi:hypothetical protein
MSAEFIQKVIHQQLLVKIGRCVGTVECGYWTEHVVLIEIQLNAYNKYLSRTEGVSLRFVGVVYFCIFGICFYELCCVLTLFT